MNMKKWLDKKPVELTYAELLELTNELTLAEYKKRNDISSLQTSEDAAQEIITYMLEKSQRGKIGLKELQERSTMSHFINILKVECRNSINYIVRKKKVQRQLYNTNSLDEVLYENKTLEDFVSDTKSIDSIEVKLELAEILSRIDDTENCSITIKYKDDVDKCFFSYKKLAKLCYDLSANKKLTCKDFLGILLDSKTNIALNERQIRNILNEFRQYIKNNNILGGVDDVY